MKSDYFTKMVLCVIAILLCLNLLRGALTSNPVEAANAGDAVGRYQIAAWAAQSGAFTHHNGYYIVDTVTGKVVDTKAEVHGTEK